MRARPDHPRPVDSPKGWRSERGIPAQGHPRPEAMAMFTRHLSLTPLGVDIDRVTTLLPLNVSVATEVVLVPPVGRVSPYSATVFSAIVPETGPAVGGPDGTTG